MLNINTMMTSTCVSVNRAIFQYSCVMPEGAQQCCSSADCFFQCILQVFPKAQFDVSLVAPRYFIIDVQLENVSFLRFITKTAFVFPFARISLVLSNSDFIVFLISSLLFYNNITIQKSTSSSGKGTTTLHYRSQFTAEPYGISTVGFYSLAPIEIIPDQIHQVLKKHLFQLVYL